MPPDSYGGGAGVGIGIQVSDARSAEDLRGPFDFLSWSAGPGYGGVAKDSKTHVISGGAAVGTPGVTTGTSHTEVLRFGWCDSWLGVCIGPPSS